MDEETPNIREHLEEIVDLAANSAGYHDDVMQDCLRECGELAQKILDIINSK